MTLPDKEANLLTEWVPVGDVVLLIVMLIARQQNKNIAKLSKV